MQNRTNNMKGEQGSSSSAISQLLGQGANPSTTNDMKTLYLPPLMLIDEPEEIEDDSERLREEVPAAACHGCVACQERPSIHLLDVPPRLIHINELERLNNGLDIKIPLSGVRDYLSQARWLYGVEQSDEEVGIFIDYKLRLFDIVAPNTSEELKVAILIEQLRPDIRVFLRFAQTGPVWHAKVCKTVKQLKELGTMIERDIKEMQ